MTCPKCDGKTKVVDTRDVPNGRRRRHECLSCLNRFNTIETTMDVYDELLHISEDIKRKFDDVMEKRINELHKIKESFYYTK